MFNPWLAFMPNLHFPFSGAVNQNIAPETDWFFSAIPGHAGNGALEKKIVEQYSYGNQLDKIAEALLVIAKEEEVQNEPAILKLQEMHEAIQQLKEQQQKQQQALLEQQLEKLKADNPQALQALLNKFC